MYFGEHQQAAELAMSQIFEDGFQAHLTPMTRRNGLLRAIIAWARLADTEQFTYMKITMKR